jgi:tetratricopeptide (TPR) repeat protein
MKKRCSQCQAILLESVTQCPLCYADLETHPPHFSLDDSQMVYVKRKNEKIFGPFPRAKVSSLISGGKLANDEWVSVDREKWFPVSEVAEFGSLVVGSSGSAAVIHDDNLPGHKSELASALTSLPGLKTPAVVEELPTLKQNQEEKHAPFAETDLPGPKTDLPGPKTMSPSGGGPLPGLPSNLPAPKGELPGLPSNLPAPKGDLPGLALNLPGSKGELPGLPSNLPGSKGELPGLPSNLPTEAGKAKGQPETGDAKEGEDKGPDGLRDFSLPPLGGGSLPEMKIDLNPSGSRSLELGDIGDHGRSGQGLNLSSGLLGSSEGLDLSALGGQTGASAPTASGLDLDHGDRNQAPPSFSLNLGDEETMPLEATPAREKGSARGRRASGGLSKWVLPSLLGLVAVVAALFFLKIGPFSRKGEDASERGKVQTGPPPTAEVVSDHERNLLNLDYVALSQSANGQEMIHCESALILAWFFHEHEPLVACQKFIQTPVNTAGDSHARRFQFFRALLLHQGLRPTVLEKIYSGAPVADPLKIMEDLLSLARSENNRAPVWSFLAGLVHLEKKDRPKAVEAFSLLQSTESAAPFGVIWFLSLLQDEGAQKTLNEKTEWEFWRTLAQGLSFLEKNQTHTLLAFPGGFPRVAVADAVVLEKVGRRFRAINYALSALSAWEQGQLDTSSNLCDRAMTEDEPDQTVWQICSRLRMFHGQLGKFSTTLSMNQELPTILSWLIEGRRNPAMTAWEELKNRDPAGSLVLAPLVLMLTGVDAEEVDAAIQAALEADLPRTLEFLWTGIWQRPDRIPVVEKAIVAWREKKKDESAVVTAFLRILALAGALQAQEWSKAVEHLEGAAFTGSVGLELEALGVWAGMMAGKTRTAPGWAELNMQRAAPGARAASAILSILTTAGKLQEAHQILDKYQQVFLEPMFLKSAAQLYLSGTRKDRLMRARFFAERALKANPQDAEALFLVGFIQLESGQHESGGKTILQAVQAMSHPVHAWFMRWSELESRLKRPHMALAAMDAGLRQSPDHGPFLFRKAQILATQDNPKEALNLLEKTRNAGIEEVQRYILEGRCHVSLRQKREAETAFQKAVKADPNNILARFLLAKTQLGNGALRPAIPNLVIVAEQLEKYTLEQRLPEEAIHWQTETLDSMLAETCRLLGGAYKETGNRALAIKYVKKYAGLVPDGPRKDEALRLLLLLGGE